MLTYFIFKTAVNSFYDTTLVGVSLPRHRRASIKRGKTARVYLLLILLASFDYAFDVIVVNNAFDFISHSRRKKRIFNPLFSCAD